MTSKVQQGALQKLLSTMKPKLNSGVYVYASIPFIPSSDNNNNNEGTTTNTIIWNVNNHKIDPNIVISTIREKEGLSMIIPEDYAIEHNISILYRAAWITLTVNSELDAVGFTGAFSTVLANANISCNVVAGAYHDHLFVPYDKANDAMNVLQSLQQQSSKSLLKEDTIVMDS